MIKSPPIVACYKKHPTLSLLFFLILVQSFGLAWYGFCLFKTGYLPIPFVDDKNDTFMDFFHTLFWSVREGSYSEWGSVYPPLTFIFLKLVTWMIGISEQFPDAFSLRENCPKFQHFIVSLYILIPALCFFSKDWNRFLKPQKTLIYLLLITSAPFLFGMERGNLIVITLPLISLLLSVENRNLQAWILAILINLKPYFLVLTFLFILRDSWKSLISTLIYSGFIFLITGWALEPDFILLFSNIIAHSENADTLFSIRTILALPSTISVFSHVLKSDIAQNSRLLSQLPLNFSVLSSAVVLLNQLTLAACAGVIWLNRSKLKDQQVIAALLIIITNWLLNIGGYSLLFYLPILPVLSELRFSKCFLIIICVLSAPLDWIVIFRGPLEQQFSFLAGTPIIFHWELGLGSLLRPILNFSLLLGITIEFFQLIDFNFIIRRFDTHPILKGASTRE